MKGWFPGLLVLVLLVFSLPSTAHPLAPRVLDIKEQAAHQYQVTWRTSVRTKEKLDVQPVFPADCEHVSEAEVLFDNRTAVSANWSIRCDRALQHRVIEFKHLQHSALNVILRFTDIEGRRWQTIIDRKRPSIRLGSDAAALPAFLKLGVTHLLGGLDHLLFVLGLMLLVSGWLRLIKTLTAFTLGHSVTLAAATLGYLNYSSAWAEFGIAISLLVLALEVARTTSSARTSALTLRPASMAMVFGLIHGLGFAGVLNEAGLASGDIPMALLGFNLGIEFGQVGFVLVTLFMVRFLQIFFNQQQSRFVRWAMVYLIGTLAVYWCLDRAMQLV